MHRSIQAPGFRCTVQFDASGIIARAEAARDRALAQVGETIRARSVAIAPLRSGAMAASAQVESAAGKVTVRYGTAYAVYQHERADFHHPNGGRAGFLRSAVEDPAAARTLLDAFVREL